MQATEEAAAKGQTGAAADATAAAESLEEQTAATQQAETPGQGSEGQEGEADQPTKANLEGESNYLFQRSLFPDDNVHPDLPTRTGLKTQAIFEYGDAEVPLQSRTNGPGEWLTKNLPNLDYGSKIAAGHVEGHAAGIMRKYGLAYGDLYLNYVDGPCSYCEKALPKLLDQGTILRVHFTYADGSVGIWQFEGGVSGYKVIQ